MTISDEMTRPIVIIESRTAQEVFDIMCDRIRRAALAQPSAPEGWVMMPEEPTPEMCDAGMTNGDGIGSMYRAMIAAAPSPSEKE